jgi:hypothetical protein
MKSKASKAATIQNVKRLTALVKTGLKAGANEEAALTALHAEYIKPLQNAEGFIGEPHKAAFKAISKAVKVIITDWYLSAPRVVQGVAYDVPALRAMYATGSGEAYRAADKTIGVKSWRYVNTHVKRKPATGAAGKTAQLAMKRSKAAKGKSKAAKPAPELSAPQLLEQLVAALRKLSPQSRIVQATEARNQLVGLIDEARSEIDHQPRKPAKVIKPRKAVAVEAPAAVQ